MANPPEPVEGYQRLDAADDPIGLKEAMPAGFMEFADRAKELEEASDEQLKALLENDEGNSPPVAVSRTSGPLAPPELAQADSAWEKRPRSSKSTKRT